MKPSRAMPATYEGRQQAYIKHVLLESYLEALVMIIGLSTAAKKGGEVEICFVDCFAGPWQSPTDDLSGTSISLSLRILAACKLQLSKLGVATKMRALYVEKDAEAFARLDAYLGRQDNSIVETACFKGDFLHLRQSLLNWCGSRAFCFFFIDPKGFKEIGVGQLAPLLKRKRSEFLINFMYMFVNRAASMEEQKAVMLQLLGAEANLNGLDPDEREDRILSLYRAGLLGEMRDTNGPDFPPRSAYARILDVTQARVKYHLVYVTSHPKGVVKFMESSESAERVQKTVRDHVHFEAREQAALTKDLFADEVRPPESAARAAALEIDRFWLRYLKDGARTISLGEFASMLESTDYFPGELQTSLKELIQRGFVVNEHAKRKRTTRPLHYEDSERLRITPEGHEALQKMGG